MKTITLLLSLVAIAHTSFSQTTNFIVDFKQSNIVWTGKKVGGEHTGNLKVKSGTLSLNNGLITKAEFVIDMTSLTNTDIKDESTNASLVGHLTSADFFDVAKYPEAKLEIIETTKSDGEFYTAKGNLTIKGITKPYTFRYIYKFDDGVFVGMANLQINRADYNVQYGSESFFKNLGDKVIYDIFELQVKLVGKSL